MMGCELAIAIRSETDLGTFPLTLPMAPFASGNDVVANMGVGMIEA